MWKVMVSPCNAQSLWLTTMAVYLPPKTLAGLEWYQRILASMKSPSGAGCPPTVTVPSVKKLGNKNSPGGRGTGVGLGVAVGVPVGVGISVAVGMVVAVGVGPGVAVAVGTLVGVWVGPGVNVGTLVGIRVDSGVDTGVDVGVGMVVGVGDPVVQAATTNSPRNIKLT